MYCSITLYYSSTTNLIPHHSPDSSLIPVHIEINRESALLHPRHLVVELDLAARLHSRHVRGGDTSELLRSSLSYYHQVMSWKEMG